MAEPIGSRVPPRPGGLYGQDRRETQRQIRQLQQPRVRIPAAPEQGTAAGAGWASARSTAVAIPSGTAWADAWSVTNHANGAAIGLHENAGFWVENRLGVTTAGMYVVTAKAYGRFASGAPAVVRLNLRGVASASGSADTHARETQVPVDSAGEFRVSATIAGWIDPAVYDGINPKLFYLGGPSVWDYGPQFDVDVVRVG